MKVYVGTYKKYNAGSIAGAWVDLDEFANYADFVKECKRIHRDEYDPEFMIQDVERDGEDWQAGLSGENISDYEDYWTLKAEAAANGGEAIDPIGKVTRNEAKNGIEIRFFAKPPVAILDELKARGWRWSRFAGCWYNRYTTEAAAFAEKIARAAIATVAGGAKPRRSSFIPALESEAKSSLVEYCAWLEKHPERVARLWKRDVAGHIRDLVAAVKLDSGEWLTFKKASIETSHCEGEDDGRGRSMKDAQAGCRWFETEVGFKISNNIKSYYNCPRGKLDYLNGENWKRETWCLYEHADDCTHIESKSSGYYWKHDRAHCREISPREWSSIRRAEAWRAISKRRRVNTYWRRFGASKLRTWTYWTEA